MQAAVPGQLLDIEDGSPHCVWRIGLKHEHRVAKLKPPPVSNLNRGSEWVTHRMKLLRDFQSKSPDREPSDKHFSARQASRARPIHR